MEPLSAAGRLKLHCCNQPCQASRHHLQTTTQPGCGLLSVCSVARPSPLLPYCTPAAAAVQVKMRELGVLGNANYKLVCMLDHKAMLTVQTEKYGVFDCKPLQFIWAKVQRLLTHRAVLAAQARQLHSGPAAQSWAIAARPRCQACGLVACWEAAVFAEDSGHSGSDHGTVVVHTLVPRQVGAGHAD